MPGIWDSDFQRRLDSLEYRLEILENEDKAICDHIGYHSKGTEIAGKVFTICCKCKEAIWRYRTNNSGHAWSVVN